MELFQTVWKTFRSEKSVKAFTQMTFIEGRCSNAQSKVDLHTSLCEDHLLISDLWIFARTHSLTHSLTRMLSEKFRVKLRLLSWNFYTFFSCTFHCILNWPRLTDALLKRQLPALNPATGSSPSDIRDKSPAMTAVPLSPPALWLSYVSPVLSGGLWGDLRYTGGSSVSDSVV